MSNVEKLSIALVPEMDGLGRGAVEGGDYATASEVVRDPLSEWKQRRTLRQRAIGELRQLWAEGLGSGPGRFDTLDAIKAEARRRWDGQRRLGPTPGVVTRTACRSPHCSGFLSPPGLPRHFRARGTLPISRKGLDLVSPCLAKIVQAIPESDTQSVRNRSMTFRSGCQGNTRRTLSGHLEAGRADVRIGYTSERRLFVSVRDPKHTVNYNGIARQDSVVRPQFSLAQQACRQGFTVCYLRLPRPLPDLTLARADGRFPKPLSELAKIDLLVLDDWGLAPTTDAQRSDL